MGTCCALNDQHVFFSCHTMQFKIISLIETCPEKDWRNASTFFRGIWQPFEICLPKDSTQCVSWHQSVSLQGRNYHCHSHEHLICFTPKPRLCYFDTGSDILTLCLSSEQELNDFTKYNNRSDCGSMQYCPSHQRN